MENIGANQNQRAAARRQLNKGLFAGRRVACGKSGSAFAADDTLAYLYNMRSELTNATATADADYRYGYAFDDIGNRGVASERGTSTAYTANALNQYTQQAKLWGGDASSPHAEEFQPQYDADGNETLVKTATGIWTIAYNGENRPIRWIQGDTSIAMSYDRMGRRVTKNDQRLVYNGYLQIANFHSTTPTSNSNYFVWDPTEPIATRPLVWNRNGDISHYVFDGNKNVSEVIASGNDVAAHYEYAPFGAITAQRGESAAANRWRFSSEYAEDETGTVYYNYRHYEPGAGRWMARDPLSEFFVRNLYGFVYNSKLIDLLGLLEFDMDCQGIKSECLSDIASLLDDLDNFINQLKSKDAQEKERTYRNAVDAYKISNGLNETEFPRDWDTPEKMIKKLEVMSQELKKDQKGVRVFCCAKKIKDSRLEDMCKSTASAYGAGAAVPVRYQGRIVICPDGMADRSRYGGCGCLMVHELLRKLGFRNLSTSRYNTPKRNKEIESRNNANENGMIRLARILLNRNCNGYDTF